jgi:very-short-patch-repair endonuclease
LVREQHGVITHAQLRALGYSRHAIAHRITTGRLHVIHKGVYAVGRPELTQHGHWMAAVLAGGAGAALSHRDAAALYEILTRRPGPIHLSVPGHVSRRRTGIRFHERHGAAQAATTTHDGIPVTTIVQTLVNLAATETTARLTRAVNEADKRDLIDPDTLRAELDRHRGHRGVRPLRTLLDRAAFVLTDSALEDRFLPIARRAGLPTPVKHVVNGHQVDFHFPALGLVVECDGLRYHRTQLQQAADVRRDQAHLAAGILPLRFTHGQIRHEPAHVERVLRRAATRSRPPAVSAPRPPSPPG